MKHLIAGLFVVLAVSGVAFADDQPVINDPSGFYQKAKALVDSLEPREGAFLNLENRTVMGYTGARIFSKDVRGYIVNAVFGYSVDQTVLLGADVDLLGSLLKLTGSRLTIPWVSTHVGFNCGYSFEDDGLAYGPSVSASVKW